MRQRLRISRKRRSLLELFSPDLLEQLAELEWLREQVRQAEKPDPQQILAQFKAYRQEKTTKAKRTAH